MFVLYGPCAPRLSFLCMNGKKARSRKCNWIYHNGGFRTGLFPLLPFEQKKKSICQGAATQCEEMSQLDEKKKVRERGIKSENKTQGEKRIQHKKDRWKNRRKKRQSEGCVPVSSRGHDGHRRPEDGIERLYLVMMGRNSLTRALGTSSFFLKVKRRKICYRWKPWSQSESMRSRNEIT